MTEITVPPGSPLEQLIFFLSLKSTITRISESPKARNGLSYCYVEVEAPGGSRYVLHSFGQEAISLYEMATKHVDKT